MCIRDSYSVTVEVEYGINDNRVTIPGEVLIWVTKPGANDKDNDPDRQISFTLGEGQATPYGDYPNVDVYKRQRIETIVADHFKMFFRYMLDKKFNKFDCRNRTFNISIIFVTIIVKSNIFTIVRINPF